MILLFGDSWARHATKHVYDPEQSIVTSSMFVNGESVIPKNIDRYGYRHWELNDIFVEFRTEDWLSSYFTQHSVITLSQPANSLDNIGENIKNCVYGCSNLSEPVYAVVFQTDPLRNFAYRADYTCRDVVWPNFAKWCEENNFDYQTHTLNDLLEKMFVKFYNDLMEIELCVSKISKLDFKILLVGGVNKVHRSVNQTSLKVIIPSVSEFFGLKSDTVIENHLALHRLVDWWTSEVPGKHRYKILKEWDYYHSEVVKKANFWIDRPEYFAGRHLTSSGFKKLANQIEIEIMQYQDDKIKSDQANL